MKNIIGQSFRGLTVLRYDRREGSDKIGYRYFFLCLCNQCKKTISMRRDKIIEKKMEGCYNCFLKSRIGERNPNWKGIGNKPYNYTKRRKKKYPLKIKAVAKINQAIQSGKLKRKPCEVCKTNKDVHAHHDDYSKPLEVRWLCRKHHREFHNSLKSVDNPYGAISEHKGLLF